MSKSLNPEIVLLRTKAGNLQNVKNLNLWGNDIDDVSLLRQMPNIEVVSLSVNKITTLKYFQYCSNLTQLYLRKNLIQDLSQLQYLTNLPNLKVLWLWDNPCAELPDYRQQVLSVLPNLVKLDNQAVSNQERASGARREPAQRAPQPPRRNQSPVVREQSRKRQRDPRQESRNENVLCAVLALLKELDEAGLELVRRDIDRKLAGRQQINLSGVDGDSGKVVREFPRYLEIWIGRWGNSLDEER